MCKTEPNETKVWFRSPFMPCGQEMDRAYSIACGACTGLGKISLPNVASVGLPSWRSGKSLRCSAHGLSGR